MSQNSKTSTRSEIQGQTLSESLKRKGQSSLSDADICLILNQHAGVTMTDQHGTITYVNDRFCELSKYAREELLGQNHHLINSGYHAPEFFRDMWRTLTNGQVWKGEIKNQAKDGRYYWVDTTIVPVLDEQGQPIRYIAMQTDITRYKQTEEDLYLTQLVVENSPAIIFRWRYAPEEGWPVEFVSHNVDQFGYTPDDFLVTNLPYTSIMHPDDNDRIKHEIETYQADGIDRFQLEYRIMTKAGQVRWVDERTVIERDATGRITHTQGLIIDVTDHKQAALALHESETLFRATFEEAPLGIGLTDTEGGVMTSNLVLQAMLGYSGAELQHLTIADFIHANDIDQYVSFHRDLANGTRHICQFEHRYLRKDGQVIWSRITASPVRDQDGRTLFHMTMVEDITQLKQTEQALHQSEARYLALVTNLGEGIISAGPDDEIIFANPVAEEIFGVPSGGLISKKLKEFTRPEQFDTIRSKMEQLRTGQKCSFSLEVIRPNGQHRQLLVTATPNVNDELQFSGMFGVIRDITERIRTEETLAKDPNLLRTLIDNMPDLIYVKDTEGRFIISNLALERLLGVKTQDDIIGKTDLDLFPQELAAKYHADDQELLRAGQSLLNYEEPSLDSDGHKLWLSTSKVPLRDNQDNIIGLVGISRDVTMRKQAEEMLQLTQFTVDHSAIDTTWVGPEAKFWYVNDAVCRNLGYTREELLSMTVHDIQANPASPEMWPAHWQELKQRGFSKFETQHRRKNGEIISVEVTANYITFGGKEYNCAFWHDITERKQLEQHIRESLEHRTRQVHTSTEIAQEIATSVALDDIFRRVVVLIQERVGYPHVDLYMVQDASLVLREGTGEAGQLMKEAGHKIALETESSLVARAARSGEPVLALDVFQEPEWVAGTFRSKTQAKIAVPIRFGTEVLGVLDVQSETVAGINEEDQLLLTGLCGQIAVVINYHLAEAGRRQVGEALRRSEEKYRSVVENVKEVIFQTDAEGHFTFLNPSWTEVTGFLVQEAMDTPILRYIHHQDREHATRLNRALMAKEVDYVRHEFRLLTKGDQLCWIELYARLVQAPDDVILGITGTITDITDRKRAEQALRASEMRFRTLTTHAPAGIFETDAQGLCTFVNQRWCDLAGITPDEALGEGLSKVIHPDDIERVVATWIAAQESHQEFAVESRYLTPTGQLLWTYSQAVALYDEIGEVTGYIGTVTDISESKQMNALLSQRADQLMLISDISSKFAEVLDLDSVLDRAAQLVHTTFGYHHVALFLLENDVARLKAIAGSYKKYFPADHTQEFEQGIIGWVATHGEKLVVSDVSQEPRYMSKIADQTVTKAELCLPIKVASQIVGILDLQSPQLNGFGENDIILMETLVDQIAVAIENARLHQAVQLELVERQKTEAVLRESEERTRLIIENALDAVVGMNADGIITQWNLQAEQIFGWSSQEAIGQHLGKLIIPTQYRAAHEQGLKKFMATGEGPVLNTRIEITALHRDGDEFPVELAVVPIQMEGSFSFSAFIRDITQRKQMEETLAQERNLLRTVINATPDWIFIKDQDHRFRLINQSFAEALQLSPDACIGQSVRELGFPEDAVNPDPEQGFHSFWVDDREVMEQGEVKHIDVESVAINGRTVYLNVIKVPLRNETGEVRGVLGYARDITDRILAEQQLKESEAHFREMTENIQEVFWLRAPDRMLYINPAYEKIWGRSREELYQDQTAFIRSIHPDDRPRVLEALQKEGDNTAPIFDHEYRIVRPDGSIRWVRARNFPIKEDGRIVRSAGCADDITERKQIEVALAEERNLLRTVIDATPDWIFIKDQEHRFRMVNQGHAALFGLTPDDIIGKTDLDLGIPEEIVKGNPEKGIQGFWPDDREVMERGEPKFIEEEPAIINGESFILSTVKVPLRDAIGNVWGVLGFVHDITHLKQVQDELLEAKEAAEAATQVKSEFLANMSHEIRTPLNAIIGMTSLLLDTSLSSEQHDFAETIRTSGDGLLTIINDILDFSKIEAGKLELEQQPFDLRQCLEEALDLVAIKAIEKKLDLIYSIDESTPGALIGDVTRLRQILVNLLTNAVKFTEHGEVVLSVRSQRLKRRPSAEEQAGQPEGAAPTELFRQVHFSIRDTGIGILRDRMDRLFQSFSQVDASTTRKYGGTGLGLTISKRLSEMMSGEMWVESSGIPGEGSTFHFSILAEVAPDQPQVNVREKQPELTGKQLLIVDDNATNRLILAHQARRWGMQPRAAASGPEALDWIGRGDPFDLVILDMHMPEMDGLTLAQAIQKQRSSQTLPLVMLTSLGQREIGDQKGPVEFAAYLTKPIKPVHLLNTLLAIFQGGPVKIRPKADRPAAFEAELGQSHPLRILLAEDNVVNQKVALSLLKRMGYRADVAANGLEVLHALQRQPYDLVLMDMQMPEMDGLEATRRIRAQDSTESSPWIIAMTANALPGDRERCLEAGMNDYVSKPVRPEALAEALRRCQPRVKPQETKAPAETELITPDQDSQNQPDDPVLDAAVLDELRQLLGDEAPQVIAEVIDLFIESSPPLLDEMRTAVQTEAGDQLFRAAHTLKASSAHLGAVRLAAMCEVLEQIGQAGHLDEAAAKLAELVAEYSQVTAALEAEKEGDRS